MPQSKNASLRRLFLLWLAAGYVLSALVSLVLFFSATRSLTDTYARRFAQSRSILEQNRLKGLIGRETVLCQKLADDPVIRQWLANELDQQLTEKAFLQLESYQKLFRDRTVFIATSGLHNYHISLQDEPFGSPTKLDPMNPADRWFFETTTRSDAYWINVNYDRSLDEVRVWINTIVRDHDGSVLGVAGTGMELTSFLNTLINHGEPNLTTILTNADGQIVAHPDRKITEFNARVEQDADRIDILSLFPNAKERGSLKVAMGYAQVNPPTDLSREIEPDLLKLQYLDKPVTLALSRIPELNWFSFVLVETPLTSGLSDYIPFLLAMLLSLSLLSLLLVNFLNRLILKPIGHLTEAANQIAGGNYSLSIDTNAPYETGTLARAFMGMSEQVRYYTEKLESLVEERTRELAHSQERIAESIRYGRLIQDSIMPAESDLAAQLESHWTHLAPLDTVGGDFVFFQATDDGFVAALADCTGHGIPGAFMSMLGASLLNRIVDNNPRAEPSLILSELHHLLRQNLRGTRDTAHLENGMDITLCRYNRARDTLSFSGAGLPLFVIRERPEAKVLRYDGHHLHLGFSRSGEHIEPKTELLEAASDCIFILASDGVYDLPGGERGFGLGIQRFERLLQSHVSTATTGHKLPPRAISVPELGTQVLQQLDRWQQNHLARDDLSLFAFKPDRKGERLA